MSNKLTRRRFIDTSAKTILATGASCCALCHNSNAASSKNISLDSFCGLYCGACPGLISGKCLGCKKKVLKKGDKECEVKKCATKKGVDSCVLCKSFPCSKVNKFLDKPSKNPKYGLRHKYFAMIKENGNEEWKKEMKTRWTCKKCGAKLSYSDKSCPKCRVAIYTAQQEFDDYKKK